MGENKKTERVELRISPIERKRLVAIANFRGLTISGVIMDLIRAAAWDFMQDSSRVEANRKFLAAHGIDGADPRAVELSRLFEIEENGSALAEEWNGYFQEAFRQAEEDFEWAGHEEEMKGTLDA